MPEYVYGIVARGVPAPSVRGIANAPLRLIPGTTASALVSELPEREVRLGRDEMLAHARVLEQALQQGGTVLPMRFGVLLDGPDEVRERLLEEHAEELTLQLEQLEGHVEMNVRCVYEEDALIREVVAEDARIAELRERVRRHPEEATYHWRIQLGELVARAVERKRDADAEGIAEELAAVCVAWEPGTPAHERVVLHGSFLVTRERLQEFDAVLDRLAEGQAGRIRFKCTGPLPPHSFVELAGSA